MRTILSILIIIALCGYFYHNTYEVKSTPKSQITNVDTTDFGCTEEVEFDTVVKLNKFKQKDIDILKQPKFLGDHYVKDISFKKYVTIINISTDIFDKKVYKTKDNLVVSYNQISTSNSETIVCDYNTGKCKIYDNLFVTDVKSNDELEVLLYEYDTTHVHDVTYMGDYELGVFNLKTRNYNKSY